jgi:hypothetical protein
MPTATAPARVPKIPPKSTSAILSNTHTLVVTDAAAAPVPDMAITKMQDARTVRAHKKQRRSDMSCAQHADTTQQQSTMINRRVPDKTHTRQPAPELRGVRTGANGSHVRDPPPLARSWRLLAPVRTPRSAQPPRGPTHLRVPAARADSALRRRRPATEASLRWFGDGFIAVVSVFCIPPMAALLARNPLRIHPETFHFPY